MLYSRLRVANVPHLWGAVTEQTTLSVSTIACVSPSALHAEETRRTLAFACRARSIKNAPVVQMDPQDKLIHDVMYS